MKCLVCNKRKAATRDDLCRTCRQFINDYVTTGGIIPKTGHGPTVADVLLVMRKLGVSQARAVALLGGTP